MSSSNNFQFVGYDFDAGARMATFQYASGAQGFSETVEFPTVSDGYDPAALGAALRLAWVLGGTSYYKAFPSRQVSLPWALTPQQAAFFTQVYQEGMSQFAFENNLTRQQLAEFSTDPAATATAPASQGVAGYGGVVALQSGGKDSLLTTALLQAAGVVFTPWYVPYSPSHPAVLDELGAPLRQIWRVIDRAGLARAAAAGGLNGHVPVTYIVLAYAVIDAILSGSHTILASVGHEGDEPHQTIGDLPVNHQWAKTWAAEQAFAGYVSTYISPDLRVGSPLRSLSELRIAELFAERAWPTFGGQFSSCNVANYQQGQDNTRLVWCGHCPKCANSFLLFAPFVAPAELAALFGGQNLFAKPELLETFRGLLGDGGVMKPLECVAEVAELQLAYHMARQRWPEAGYELPFTVPPSGFDYRRAYPSQQWASEMVGL